MKTAFLIILLSLKFVAAVKAEDCVSCTTELKPFDKIEKAVEALQSATAVNCVDQLKLNVDEEYVANFSKLPKKSEVVNGIKLSGSGVEINFLKKMLGEYPTDGWEKAKGCDTVLCALTKVYDSKEAAQRTLNIAKRTGYIVSAQKDFTLDGKRMGQLFSFDEIQVIDLAYKKLPPSYNKLKTLDRLKRLPDGLSSPRAPNAAAYASPGFHSSYFELDGEITFLDGAFTSDKTWGPLVAVHELSHHMDFSKSEKTRSGHSESPAYLKISGWKKIESYETDKVTGKKVLSSKWEHDKDKKFVTDYAGTQPSEDLGDSAAFYVFEPRKLKAIDPDKYDYIKKNLFGGKEYLNEPDLQVADNDILNRCMQDSPGLTLWGNSIFKPSLSPNCLDKFIKEYVISDPKLCDYNKAQLNQALFDRINPAVATINDKITKCDLNIKEYEANCLKENNYQKTCSVEKCQLDSVLASKTRQVSPYYDNDKIAYESVQKKMGKTEFVASTLLNGLSGNEKFLTHYPLNMQQGFLDNAGDGFENFMKKENFKFDSSEPNKKRFQISMMLDKKLSENIESFQEKVLKSATKSQEKNLELIKNWAKEKSLEDSPLFDDLAETIRKFAKSSFF